MRTWTLIRAIFAAAGGALCWFLGGWDSLLLVLVVMVAVDYLTGWLRSVFEKRLSSTACWRGIAKKVMTFTLVGVAHVIGYHVIGIGDAIRSAVILFYVSNEGLSILENAAAMGLPFPEKLKDILAILHDRQEEKDDGNNTQNESE